MFGRPQGLLGRLGGHIMARMNAACGAWVAQLLDVHPTDRVLEVGFGSGVVVAWLAARATAGLVAGVDPSPEMVGQALARNREAVRGGRVDLRCASVESLPFPDGQFDKVLAINAVQVWPDPRAGCGRSRAS